MITRLRQNGPSVWIVGVAIAASCTLVLALVAAGGAPVATPAGLPDAGRLGPWLVAVLPLLVNIAATATIGCIAIGCGAVGPRRPGLLVGASVAALGWAGLAGFQLAVVAIDLRGRAPILGSPQIRSLLATVALTVVVALAADIWRSARHAWVLYPLAVLALIPPILAGHARTSDSPVLATIALTAHVAAAATWIGGLGVLAALAVRRRSWWNLYLSNYSRIALGCTSILAVSGIALSLTRLDSPSQLVTSGYGALISIKVVLFVGLAGLGYLQRRYVVARRGENPPAFVLLAGAELTVMALVVVAAIALAQTPPPV